MKRSIGTLLILVGTALPLGCGGQADPNGGGSSALATRATSATSSSVVPPNEIVAMFSDSIRRGDKETTIKLITLAAREEIQRRGMTIDPPGSPEASYKIGEVKFLDQDRDAAYVESFWIEPGVNGQPNQQTEVVWAVQLEPEGWRISGLAIDNGPNEEPTLVDFENLEISSVNEGTSVANTPAINAPASNGGVAATTVSNSTGLQQPPANGLQLPPNATATPSPNGFTMPELSAPQISQPPNTQFR